MISRRGFILSGAALGGGLILAYTNHRLDDGDAASKFADAGQVGWPLNAWIKIDTNDEITFAIHRAEMGQGIVTGLAQLLAEELDTDWPLVRFEFPPVDRDYYNFTIVLDARPQGDGDVLRIDCARNRAWSSTTTADGGRATANWPKPPLRKSHRPGRSSRHRRIIGSLAAAFRAWIPRSS